MNLPTRARPEPEQRRLLRAYLEILYTAEPHRNLTRVPREQAWPRHVEESLSLLSLHPWREGDLILDFGSGGGIPGIPLAIALPGLRVTLLERDLPKAAFLESCVEALGLDRVLVMARDARELGRQADRPRAQVIVSRAAAPPLRLVPLVAPLMGDDARALLLVGRTAVVDRELREVTRRLNLSVPEILETSCTRVLSFSRS